jgi:DNA-binding transcriptional regulator YhcF (GntR family)
MSKPGIRIHFHGSTPKYRQVMDAIIQSIERKHLRLGDKLPSINQICLENDVHRDTVMVALNQLKAKGIIRSYQGKGYYISSIDIDIKEKVFVLLEELNERTSSIYNSFIKSFDSEISADLFFVNHNLLKIRNMVSGHLGKYTHYVMASEIYEYVSHLITKDLYSRLIVIGRSKGLHKSISCVYQDCESDMYEMMKIVRKSLSKYCRLVYLHQGIIEPEGRINGFIRYCREENVEHLIVDKIENLRIRQYEAFFTADDRSMVEIIRQIRLSGFLPGEEVGLVSFGESILKEVLVGGLTTISVDYTEFGQRLIELIKSGKRGSFRIRSRIMQRASL